MRFPKSPGQGSSSIRETTAPRLRSALGLIALLALGSCSDSGTTPASSDPAPSEPSPPTVQSVAISVPSLNVAPGASMGVSVEVRATDGSPFPNPSISWTSLDPEILEVSTNGEVTGRIPGVANLVATVQGVADTIGLSVAHAARADTVTTVELDGDGRARLFVERDVPVQWDIQAGDGASGALAGGEVTFTESDGSFLLSVRTGDDEPAFLFVGNSRELDALLRAAQTVGGAAPPAPVILEGALLVTVVAGAVVVASVVLGAVRVGRALWMNPQEHYLNAHLAVDWGELDYQCVPLAEVAEFISRDFAQAYRDREAGQAIGYGYLGAASGSTVVEATILGTEVIHGLPGAIVITEQDLLDHAERRYGVPPEAFQSPSGLVKLVDVRKEYRFRDDFWFRGIDPTDDYCYGRIPALLTTPSETITAAPFSDVTIQVGVLSDWGNGVEGVTVEFESAIGLPNPSARTDAEGNASVIWQAGSEGEFEVTARAFHGGAELGGSPITFRITVSETPRLGIGFGDEEFSLIPAGTFQMGSTNGPSNERPVHTVTISRPFYMQKTEVTIRQFVKIMEGRESDDLRPVVFVSKQQVHQFIDRLNERYPDRDFRLPTEAEWEYAARAGTAGDYGGTGNVDEMGWHFGNSGLARRPVAQKLPNDWGLYDMHGNVAEWVMDSFGPYTDSPKTDPLRWGTSASGAVRGGSFRHNPFNVRSASRQPYPPNSRFDYIGFRLVRTP